MITEYEIWECKTCGASVSCPKNEDPNVWVTWQSVNKAMGTLCCNYPDFHMGILMESVGLNEEVVLVAEKKIERTEVIVSDLMSVKKKRPKS